MENQIYSWTTKEFEHYQKGIGWYFTLSILAFFMIVYEIYLHDYFAAITFFFILIAIYFFSRILPREIIVTITNKGLNIGDVNYPYTSLKRFWIVEHSRAKHVTLETTAYLNRFIILPLNEENPEIISGILKEFLHESEPNQETMAQRMARRLRF